MFKIDIKTAQTMFFDRPAARRNIDTRTRQVLSWFGAHVRRTAQRSIRRRRGARGARGARGTSKPGRPPVSHTGLLKKFLWFGYDATRRSVVIGPVRLPRRGRSGKAPATLEYGGTVTLPDGRKANIEPRPYMGPAFRTGLTRLPYFWNNAGK